MNRADVLIFDTELGTTLKLKAVCGDYESCIFTRERSGVGGFSITINALSDKAVEFQAKRLVYIRPMDNEHVSRVGIIVSVEQNLSGNEQVLTVTGYEAKGLTYWRIIAPDSGQSHWVVNDAGETCIKSTVNHYHGPSAATKYKIPFITIETDAGAGPDYALSERFSVLENALEDVAEACDLWWYYGIDTTNKKLKLYVSAGLDRTADQSTNPRAIFAHTRRTIGDASRIDDYEEYRNVVYVGGQGEDEAREIVEVGTATGWSRMDTFVDRRDLSLTASLNTAGENELAALAEITSVDFTATDNLVVDVNYSMNDLVTTSIFGITKNKRVTSITESWTSGGYECDVTFGKRVSSPQKMIKDQFGSVIRAVNI